jgi:putative ATPase
MSEKSNSSYVAIKNALHEVKKSGDLAVPLHLRNASTKLMKNIGYGADYQYPHDFEGNFIKENYMPNGLEDAVFYKPGNNNSELNFEKKLKRFWSEKYK